MRIVIIVVVGLLLSAVTPAAAVPLPGPSASTPSCDRGLSVDLAAVAPPPVSVMSTCPGIRPGAYHRVEDEGCSFNFVFRGVSAGGQDEGLFIGTAGHCVFDAPHEDEVYPAGTGEVVTDGQGKRVGTVAYAVDEGELDYALVRIDADRTEDVSAAMCTFGGPVGMAVDVSPGTVIHHWGNGQFISEAVQGRSGVAGNYTERREVLHAVGAIAGGDSGSGVIDADGRAIGALVRLSVSAHVGNADISTLQFHLQRAESLTGTSFELLTAPLAAED